MSYDSEDLFHTDVQNCVSKTEYLCIIDKQPTDRQFNLKHVSNTNQCTANKILLSVSHWLFFSLAVFPVVLVVVFAICWAPFHTDRLMWSFISDWTESHLEIFQYVHVISGVFFYLSSAVNPILYNLMSTRFREMFKEVMCHRPHHITPRKHSLSVTRVTLRSILSDAPLSNGAAVVEAEEEEGEVRMKDETSFA